MKKQEMESRLRNVFFLLVSHIPNDLIKAWNWSAELVKVGRVLGEAENNYVQKFEANCQVHFPFSPIPSHTDLPL